MLGATHALANPLTARYGIVHGQAIGLMLPHVIRFNGAAMGPGITTCWKGPAGPTDFPAPTRGSKAWRDFVAELVHKAGLPARLSRVRRRRRRRCRIGRRRGQAMDRHIQSARGRREADLLALYEEAY